VAEVEEQRNLEGLSGHEKITEVGSLLFLAVLTLVFSTLAIYGLLWFAQDFGPKEVVRGHIERTERGWIRGNRGGSWEYNNIGVASDGHRFVMESEDLFGEVFYTVNEDRDLLPLPVRLERSLWTKRTFAMELKGERYPTEAGGLFFGIIALPVGAIAWLFASVLRSALRRRGSLVITFLVIAASIAAYILALNPDF